jgi:hypothetical protein
VFFHELKEDFVLDLQLGFKWLNAFLSHLFLTRVILLKGDRSVFEKLFLLPIKDHWLQVIFIAHIRRGPPINKVLFAAKKTYS